MILFFSQGGVKLQSCVCKHISQSALGAVQLRKAAEPFIVLSECFIEFQHLPLNVEP